MEFELSPATMEQIIFAMEDQTTEWYVHRVSGALATGDLVEEAEQVELPEQAEEFVPLPLWQPVDGFRLMERFVATVRNPFHREHLRSALAHGRGVFRSFKNALHQSPDLERLWHGFKEREMRRIVAQWYDREREAAGLERLGWEPEESDDLTVSDLTATEFAVAIIAPHQIAGAGTVDREVMLELGQLRSEDEAAYRARRGAAIDDPGSHVVVASTPDDEVVGLAWARTSAAERTNSEWELVQLAVLPSCRGVGLGGRLLRALAAAASERGVAAIRTRLDEATMVAQPMLERLGYTVEWVQLTCRLAAPG